MVQIATKEKVPLVWMLDGAGARAEDPAAMQKELEAKFNKYAGPYPAAGTFNIDDVIDPRETRPRLIEALELALNRRVTKPQPVFRSGVMP